MWQRLLGWPDLDVVYWTLGVELMFYVWMATIFRLGLLNRIVPLALGWLVGAATLSLVQRFAPLPELLRTLLNFEHISFFIAGIVFYRIRQDGLKREYVGIIIAAGLAPGILAGWHGLGVSLAVFGIFALAMRGWLRWIVNPVTAWGGAISYTLYLTHRAWGDYIMMELIGGGLPKWAAFGLAIMAALMLASLVTLLIERPAMKLIRNVYKNFIARKEPAATVSSFAAGSVVRSRTHSVEQHL
jgi:peptidoglycan/LPS O-acetylase OafA/YrhL